VVCEWWSDIIEEIMKIIVCVLFLVKIISLSLLN
jgi:hypothetical protein